MKPSTVDYRHRAYCVRIEALNGTVVRLTGHPRDLLMSNGAVYKTDSGYQFTGSETGTGMAPGVMDLQGVVDTAGLSRAALSDGTFDAARVYVFAADYLAPVEDAEPIGAATLGKVTLKDRRYQVEMMAILDAMNQSVGHTYTATCQKTFGGQDYAGCKKPLGPITVTGTLTAVTDAATFRDAARSEAADWFGAGTIRFTSGANAGLKAQEIRSHAADGSLVLFEPFPYLPAVGDAYEMIPGCRHRLADCRDKWANIENFGGFAHIPAGSAYAQVGGAK